MTDTEPKVEAAHTVTITFDRGETAPTIHCHAPADGMCHAVWTCGCEEWDEGGVDDGKPWHADHHGADADYRHYGTFDTDECGLRDWFENSDEALDGEITFPVRAEWEGGYFTFHPEPEWTGR